MELFLNSSVYTVLYVKMVGLSLCLVSEGLEKELHLLVKTFCSFQLIFCRGQNKIQGPLLHVIPRLSPHISCHLSTEDTE